MKDRAFWLLIRAKLGTYKFASVMYGFQPDRLSINPNIAMNCPRADVQWRCRSKLPRRGCYLVKTLFGKVSQTQPLRQLEEGRESLRPSYAHQA